MRYKIVSGSLDIYVLKK